MRWAGPDGPPIFLVMTIVEQIASLELVKVRFRLQFLETFHFKPEMILHWRKELVRGARLVHDNGVDGAAISDFLDPPPADDPFAQKRFQKPAPPFVVDPRNLFEREYSIGEVLSLEVLFPGDGVCSALIYLKILVALGRTGMYRGAGKFNVSQLSALTHNDGWQSVWHHGAPLTDLSFPHLKAQWLVEEKPFTSKPMALRFVTPARILKNNRPLFVAEFKDIFPFILRRVTSVLYSCCRIEFETDVSSLLADVMTVSSQAVGLKWVDWRHLDANNGVQGIGGLSGAIKINSGLTEDLFTLLCLAEMFHIGKWASYGAGCFALEPVVAETVENR